ncbi:MAG: hypothetical protein CL912_15715 [Deltaproteobacteria bacterium]|nr:hypothetical protein [Deltaproteobacteria bacterium]
MICELIMERGIILWAEARYLEPSEWPVRMAFEFVYGNPKPPTSKVTVRDQEIFVDTIVPLRIYKQRRLQSAKEVTIFAYYKTIDRDALESDEERPKRKSKGKSKVDKARDTVKPTPLGRETSQIQALDNDSF